MKTRLQSVFILFIVMVIACVLASLLVGCGEQSDYWIKS